MTDPVLRMLGLARRGGNLAVGEEPVTEALKERRAKAVLLARDAAENTADRAARLTAGTHAILLTLPYDKAEVGASLGRESCAVLAVTDAGLAAAVVKKLAETDAANYGGAAALLDEKAQRTQRRKRAKAQEKKQAQAGKRPVRRPASDDSYN